MVTFTRPSTRLRGAGRRLGRVAVDMVDSGRQTYDYAVPLCRDGDSLGHVERARLILAAGLDELVLGVFRGVRTPDPEVMTASLREAGTLVEYLDRTGVLADPVSYHEPPRVPSLDWTARRVAHRSFEHVTFKSPYTPDASVPGAARYAEQTGNELAHAWVLHRSEPAPWLVCVHGAGMGDPLVDLVMFRAAALHRRGFNVAIPVLPHHGPRGAGRFQVAFPSADLAGNLHGTAQAIADVRAVLAYIADRQEPAALHGISLGGYVAAAVAALEPSIAAVVAGVPLVDIAQVFETHAARRDPDDEHLSALLELVRPLEAVGSPIALGRPATAVRRIYAGRADRFVHPEQVERLVEHWGVDASWYSGGHLGFMRSAVARQCIDDALVEGGIARRDDDGVVAVC